jgi:hypothetical protein
MSTSTAVQFIVNDEAKDLLDDLNIDSTPINDDCLSFHLQLDETLVESLTSDELLEFIGLNAESLIYINIID